MSTTGRPRVGIIGAGLAGLAAAIAASEAGADVVVFERGDEPGGATRSSAGWIWRYADLRTARACAPHGDVVVQAAIIDRLDADLAWLEALEVDLRSRDTGRALTHGARIDPPQAIRALVARLDGIDDDALRLRSAVGDARRRDDGGFDLFVDRWGPSGARSVAPDVERVDAVVFAGGGYAADLDRIAAECGAGGPVLAEWVLRAPAAGNGTSLDAALGIDALRVPATGESLVRLVPTGPELRSLEDSRALVRLGELQVPGTTIRDREGTALVQEPHDWSGAQVAWQLARSSGSGTIEFTREALRHRLLAGGTVEDALRTAIEAGAAAGRLEMGGIWLAVRAGITGTRCGLRVDGDGRLLQAGRRRLGRPAPPTPIPHAFAAGLDAADPGMGGIGSGLALALVLGRRAGQLAGSRSR